MSELLQQLNHDLADVVTRVQCSLVQVLDGRGGAGAGTIWHADGLIVTNAHVVRRDGSKQVALPDGRILPAQVIARDDERDLAALVVEADNLPTIEPGDSGALKAGQWVMALGHPWGIKNAVTGGVVIGAGANLPELAGTGREWVAVSLHLRPGHSGGPLVDTEGRIIGINTMMTGPEVGVAVPVDVVKRFLRRAFNAAPQSPQVPPATPDFV